MTIGGRIKQARKSFKLSQTVFGEKLGVSRDVINNAENDRVVPSELLFKAICSEFGVDYIWLTTGEGEMFVCRDDDDLIGLLDRVMYGESDFARSIFKGFAHFGAEDWEHLEVLTRKFLSGFSEEQVAALLQKKKKGSDHE